MLEIKKIYIMGLKRTLIVEMITRKDIIFLLLHLITTNQDECSVVLFTQTSNITATFTIKIILIDFKSIVQQKV